MKIRFWGCRGSIVTPGKCFVRYGGNTPCIDITSESGFQLILDAGIGITQLAAEVQSKKEFNILLTHTHWDHIQGLPYFPPMFFPGRKISIHAARLNSRRLGRIIAKQFSANYSPFKSINVLASMIEFKRIKLAGTEIGPYNVKACHLNHDANACGMRIECDGHSIVYAPDHETEGNDVLNKRFIKLSANADLMIHDAQYTPEELEAYRGWGHSSWKNAVDNAHAAGVGKLLLFHHDIEHDDYVMDGILRNARAYSRSIGGPEVDAAWDGLILDLSTI